MNKCLGYPVIIVDIYHFQDLFWGIGPICSSEDLDFTLDSKVGDLTLVWPIRALYPAHHGNCFREEHMTVKIRCRTWFKLLGEILFILSWTLNCEDGSLALLAFILL